MALLAAALLGSADPAASLTLDLPEGAEQTAQRREEAVQEAFPAGILRDGQVPTRTAEGTLTRTAWRLAPSDRDTLEILSALRRQIAAAGYDIVFECQAAVCGGFDFRFAVDTLDAPQMYVDLSDYAYLLARDGDVLLSLIVSRARDSPFVQLSVLAAREVAAAAAPVAAGPPDSSDPVGMAERRGHAPLDDLIFQTGSAALRGDGFASLAALARALADRPDLEVTLVGHTDTKGGLAANVALSRQRAGAVRRLLVERYGADPARITADGVGYLAPRATNATEEGRRANRRVEVVVTP